MDDRPRKDRLIQTRVPQDLESTLKDEARKRRLSVSHLIRNVLEDTFSLVDNVVTEVDRVVTDSVEMAQTLKRDAQRLAATARGHTSHRDSRRHGHDHDRHERGATRPDASDLQDAEVDERDAATPVQGVPASAASAPLVTPPSAPAAVPVEPLEPTPGPARAPSTPLAATSLADVYGFQELVLNRVATCANCGTTIARGSRAHLGMTDKPEQPRVWVCQACLDLLSQ